jgi:hypothetical protein
MSGRWRRSCAGSRRLWMRLYRCRSRRAGLSRDGPVGRRHLPMGPGPVAQRPLLPIGRLMQLSQRGASPRSSTRYDGKTHSEHAPIGAPERAATTRQWSGGAGSALPQTLALLTSSAMTAVAASLAETAAPLRGLERSAPRFEPSQGGAREGPDDVRPASRLVHGAVLLLDQGSTLGSRSHESDRGPRSPFRSSQLGR